MTALVRLDQVTKRFATHPGWAERVAGVFGAPAKPRVVHAVEDVSLEIARSEVVGLVGESGCGKSTLGRVIAGIHAPTSGSVRIAGEPVMSAGANPMKQTTRVQMIFQDPFGSLNPRMRIGDTISEGPVAHGLTTRAEARRYTAGWLDRVGLPGDAAERFPHQFSGGQRQRIAIARALAMQPDVLVCDEPVASLDVSIQAQIINLFLALRRDLALTMVFISHDLSIVRHVSDRTAIMYLGRIVELGPTAQIYDTPRHRYTRALIDSVPKLVTQAGEEASFHPIAGELPSPLAPPPGCAFHLRCPQASARCRSERPVLAPTDAAHSFACFHPL